MRRSPRERLIYFLSILFAATPFAFALIRAFSTGYDLRFLWMALASFVGAAAVVAAGKASDRRPKSVLASALILITATLLAGLAAFLLGAKSVVAAGLVAFAFGFCWAVSHALYKLSRPRII
jgi:MFS family permease